MHRHLTGQALLLSALLLAGCGGGGGDGPVADWKSQLYLDSGRAPPSTYADGSAELGGWTVLQQARIACGFGQLTQNSLLDKAAQLHAQYQTYVAVNSFPGYLSHREEYLLASDNSAPCDPAAQLCNPYTGNIDNNPYYRGFMPWDRTQLQGYGTQVSEILEGTTWNYDTLNLPNIPSLEQRGATSMRDLLNTVYHLTGAMYPGADVGFGAELQTRTSGTSVREEYRFGSLNGYQTATLSITAANGLATYPCDGSNTVPSSFIPANESPNPFPFMNSSSQKVGPPIYLKVDAGQTLTLNAVSIVDANNAAVPTTTLDWANDPAGIIKDNEIFVIPNVALAPDSSYRVTLTGSVRQFRKSTAFTRSFTLKTAA